MNTNFNFFNKFLGNTDPEKEAKKQGMLDAQAEHDKDIANNFEPDVVNYDISPTLGKADITSIHEKNINKGTTSDNNIGDKTDFVIPMSLREDLVSGKITQDEYDAKVKELQGGNNETTVNPSDEKLNKENPYSTLFSGIGRGASLESALFSLGQSVAYDGSKKTGNTLRGAGAVGKLAFGSARTLLSGYGFQDRSQDTQRTYEDRLKEDRRNNLEYYEGGGYVGEGDPLKGDTLVPPKKIDNYSEFEQNLSYPVEIKKIDYKYKTLEVPQMTMEDFEKEMYPTKDIKEKQIFEEGGPVKDLKTGEVIQPVSREEKELLEQEGDVPVRDRKNPLSLEEMLVSEKTTGNKDGVGNVKAEKGEYIKYPEGEIQEIVGDTHEKGGEDFDLPPGTLILSNDLKVDKKLTKTLKEDFDIKTTNKDTYAKVVSKFTDKIGLTKLNKDEEYLIKKLKDLVKDSPSYEVNSNYIVNKLKQIEKRKETLNKKRETVFSLLYSKQQETKGEDLKGNDLGENQHNSNLPEQQFFEEGGYVKDGKINEEGQNKLDSGEFQVVGKNLINVKTGEVVGRDLVKYGSSYKNRNNENTPIGVGFNENVFSDESTYNRNTQHKTVGGGFGKITKDNLEESIKWAYKNFPDIASRDDVFGAKYDKDGNFTFNKDIDFTKSSNNVKKYQELANSRMTTTAKDVINNPELYGGDAVTNAKDYLAKQTFDNSLARKVDDGLWGNFSAGRFSLKTQIVTPAELEELKAKNIYSVKDLIKANKNGEVKLSPASINRLERVSTNLSENSDFGLETYNGPTDITEKPKDDRVKSDTTSNITDNVAELVANKRNKGNFVYLAPDQSLPPPSAMEPHLKVKNRFQRIDPVKIGIERNIQEAYNNERYIGEQLNNLPPQQRAAALASLNASSQATINKAISQTNLMNAQNVQKAEQFNIGQSDRENIAEGQNALNFERTQLTAKAKTEKDLMDYFAFNREIQLNNILREQQLSSIDALSEDYSIDPFGNTYFDPTYAYKAKASEVSPEDKQVALKERKKRLQKELDNILKLEK